MDERLFFNSPPRVSRAIKGFGDMADGGEPLDRSPAHSSSQHLLVLPPRLMILVAPRRGGMSAGFSIHRSWRENYNGGLQR